MAVLKKCSTASENEINMAGDIAIAVIVPPAIGEDSILPTEKSAVAEHDPVTLDSDCQGLPDGPGGIFEGEVLRCEIIGINNCGGGSKRANWFPVRAGH